MVLLRRLKGTIIRGFIYIVFCFFLLSVQGAHARAVSATCEDAKVMAEKAVAHMDKVGARKALVDFYGAKFTDRDLYVFVFNSEGTIIMHKTNPEIVGKYGLDSKDVMGNYIDRRLMEVEDVGWVGYKFSDPTDRGRIKDKNTYVIYHDGYRVCVGCYGQKAL